MPDPVAYSEPSAVRALSDAVSHRNLHGRRLAAVLALGFASGFPLVLTGDTLALWLTDHGMTLGAVGAFGLVGLPYSCKFLWAPLVDRYAPPFLDRRRGWIVIAQCMTALAVAVMGMFGPDGSVVPWQSRRPASHSRVQRRTL